MLNLTYGPQLPVHHNFLFGSIPVLTESRENSIDSHPHYVYRYNLRYSIAFGNLRGKV